MGHDNPAYWRITVQDQVEWRHLAAAAKVHGGLQLQEWMSIKIGLILIQNSILTYFRIVQYSKNCIFFFTVWITRKYMPLNFEGELTNDTDKRGLIEALLWKLGPLLGIGANSKVQCFQIGNAFNCLDFSHFMRLKLFVLRIFYIMWKAILFQIPQGKNCIDSWTWKLMEYCVYYFNYLM